MKSLKPLLIGAGAIFLLVALSLLAKNAKNQGAQADVAVLDTVLPQAKLPALKIDGKENPDVYLQSLDIQVEVTGNVASTRYTMVFKNKTDRVLEGELVFPLPNERSVSYYALDINGLMREAVPVEKPTAAQIFEETEEMEQTEAQAEDTGFRIYPIPAKGTRTVSIGYEEELTLEKELMYYRLPMAYPNVLEKFTMNATVWKSSHKPLVPESEEEILFDTTGESYAASFARENYKSNRSLIFALPAPVDSAHLIMQPVQVGYYFLASVAPEMETRKKHWDDELAIIWDVSLSASERNLQLEIEMLEILFNEKKNAKVHLYFLNNELKKIGEYAVANGKWERLKTALQTAVLDGGSDYSKINLHISEFEFLNIVGNEILFFSDGISTLSDADFLKNTLAESPFFIKNRPVHCFVSSEKADPKTMKLIAGKTKGKFVNINSLSFENLKTELLNETLQFLGTEYEDVIRDVYPSIAMPVNGSFSVAGISDIHNAELTLLFGFNDEVKQRVQVKLDAKYVGRQGNLDKIWAQKKIAELDLNYESNRAALAKLGQQFGIATRNTLLIVPETTEDASSYVQRNILDEAIAVAERIKNWWNADVAGVKTSVKTEPYGKQSSYGLSDMLDDLINSGAGSRGLLKKGKIVSQTIVIKPIRKDEDYLDKLTGNLAEDYQIYLKLREDYANSPTFYFDMSNWFYTYGDKEAAIRILTSVADLGIENVSLYRLLGYRFKEYGEYELEKFVCQKVIQWRPMDPQSYRDYALALADNLETLADNREEAQAALDSLYSILKKPYPEKIIRRSRGIEEVVVIEMNRLIAKYKDLDISKIDERLIMKIPVDIRVVINWNMGNTDIDLRILDPNNEECSYRRRETSAGGRISADNTGGYGPEQFMLKKGISGKYHVYVNYFSDRQFTANGPPTIIAEIFTKYADSAEQRQIVSLQKSKTKKKGIEVAEFEFPILSQ
jgi:hypothetical protein